MISVDRRTGSAELYTPLQRFKVPVQLDTLTFGDLAFVGNGKAGEVLVGVERKRIRDLLDSFTSGRLSGHQLPGLVEMYAYRWLVVEGPYRPTEDGYIEIPRGGTWEKVRLKYAALEAYLLTLELKGGVALRRTYTIDETCAWVAQLYHWWTAKEWKEHRSHLALHQTSEVAAWTKPNLVHRIAAVLPGIDETAVMVARTFKTPLEMAIADEADWRRVPGIGKVKARQLVEAWQKGKG